MERYDYTLFDALRDDKPPAADAPQQLGAAIAALDKCVPVLASSCAVS